MSSSKKSPSKATSKPLKDRTKTVEIKRTEEETEHAAAGSAAYTLHIEPAQTPREIKRPAKNENADKAADAPPSQPSQSDHALRHALKPALPVKISVKIWNTLEWLATSALIFLVLFFIINFQAYSTLFVSKLNKLRGNFQNNSYIQQMVQAHPAGVTQQPLPLTNSLAQNQKQVPYLDIEIVPPDDRIIIPRINQNVPIVRAKSENLIKRDWSALEGDIQKALQNGVVHYPGTANPGENGNVVITGHSSYFSWDPGRFKDVFALLHQVVIGDKVVVYYQQKKYMYEVYDKIIVTPDKVDVLTQAGADRLTLITCTPVGTNLKRLVLFARPIKGN